ncbi:MAG: hypothetical protein EBU85_00110 [Actinobacteria bacterium]|nr:hypothetical protein [Actinomycetota bacterium]
MTRVAASLTNEVGNSPQVHCAIFRPFACMEALMDSLCEPVVLHPLCSLCVPVVLHLCHERHTAPVAPMLGTAIARV